MLPIFLYCSHPLDSKKVDLDYENEFLAAIENGFECLLFDFDEFLIDNLDKSLKNIEKQNIVRTVIYRGWMFTPTQYQLLYKALFERNLQLINSKTEYQDCHYLPDSLKFIEKHTPKTVFQKIKNDTDIEELIIKSEMFGDDSVILKDYVKSEKHHWDSACFVDNVRDKKSLRDKIKNLLRLRGEYLNEGIVVRKFIKLKFLTNHSKSQMPLTEEYRLFFLNNKLIGVYDYWEEGEYKSLKPNTELFEEIAKTIKSNFFSMDIAKSEENEFIIIELGDGQVSGLPDLLDRNLFYQSLKEIYLKSIN